MYDIDLYAKLGDLKEVDYRNTLAIATIIELMIQKGIFTRSEFCNMSKHLDRMSIHELKILRQQSL